MESAARNGVSRKRKGRNEHETDKGGGVMDEVLSVCLAIALMAALFLTAGWGLDAGRRGVAESCEDFGKAKIERKWYECKPIAGQS
jgi:hypothetical protein